jgi:hypothetical protein
MATDREIGRGQGNLQPVLGTGTGPGSNAQGNALPDGGGCEIVGELCWTKFDLSFETARPAFTGEHLTFQVEMVGARAWAFGFEGAHASRIALVLNDMPASGLDFGTTIETPTSGESVAEGGGSVAAGRVSFPDLGTDPTAAGDHPTDREVDVAVDDPSFSNPIEATLDLENGTWSAPLGELARGEHTVYTRARIDTTTSEVTSVTFGVTVPAHVEWQVVRKNSAPDPSAWQRANGLGDWSFDFATADYGKGSFTLVTRLVADGLEQARATVAARFN